MENYIRSLYVHFPFCKHICNYCDFFKSVPENPKDAFKKFESSLKLSLARHQEFLNQHNFSFKPLETLYIGGGTPSYWGSQGIQTLLELLAEFQIQLSDKCEFTMEVNPGEWSQSDFEQAKIMGVNRFSTGIQTLNDQGLKILDRVHNVDAAIKLMEYFSSENLNFSVDLMIGLPKTKNFNRNIIEELKQILEFHPKHLSVYILTVKGNYLHKNLIPDDEYIRAEYLAVSEYLNAHDYEHYEVSNFALSGYHSEHNLRYWQSKTVAAIGPSATGLLAPNTRYKWDHTGIEFNVEKLTVESCQIENCYMALRTTMGNFGNQISQIHQKKWVQILDSWQERGLLSTREPLKLNANGYLVLDSLMGELFAQGIV